MRLLLDQNLSHRLKCPLAIVCPSTSDIEGVLRQQEAAIAVFLADATASLLTLSRFSE